MNFSYADPIQENGMAFHLLTCSFTTPQLSLQGFFIQIVHNSCEWVFVSLCEEG